MPQEGLLKGPSRAIAKQFLETVWKIAKGLLSAGIWWHSRLRNNAFSPVPPSRRSPRWGPFGTFPFLYSRKFARAFDRWHQACGGRVTPPKKRGGGRRSHGDDHRPLGARSVSGRVAGRNLHTGRRGLRRDTQGLESERPSAPRTRGHG